jgi:hypothetical protein
MLKNELMGQHTRNVVWLKRGFKRSLDYAGFSAHLLLSGYVVAGWYRSLLDCQAGSCVVKVV